MRGEGTFQREMALKIRIFQPSSLVIISTFFFMSLGLPWRAVPAERTDLYQINASLSNLVARMISLEKKISQIEKFNPSIRKTQADLGAKMDNILAGMEVLKSKFEEDKYYFEKIFKDARTTKEDYLFRLGLLEKQIEDVKQKFDFLKEAIERAGSKTGNKGWDAAVAAMEMVNLFKEVK